MFGDLAKTEMDVIKEAGIPFFLDALNTEVKKMICPNTTM